MWDSGGDEPCDEFDEWIDDERSLAERLHMLRTRNERFTNEIIPGKLWIGDADNAFVHERSLLSKHRIESVVSIGSSTNSYENCTYSHIKYHRIVCEDDPWARLDTHFDAAADFIYGAGRVLVHCQMGISRSAAICIAYLIKHHDMSLNDAFECVKRARPVVDPNDGFVKQLQAYEKQFV